MSYVFKVNEALFEYSELVVRRAVYIFVPTCAAELDLGQSPLMRVIGECIQIRSKHLLAGYEAEASADLSSEIGF